MTVRTLITETFQDINVLEAGEAMTAQMAANGLSKLLRVLDDLNAERSGVYADHFWTFTLIPSTNPHTIGITANSPDWTVTTARPVSIDSASVILSGGSQEVRYELNLRDAEWWDALPLPSLETDIPTDLFYNPTWPNGSVYLWSVPSAAYDIEIRTRIVLADVGLDDVFTMPQGYRSAIQGTLGEYLAPVYPTATPDPAGAAKARGRIFANNDRLPSLTTNDSGIPQHGARSGAWFDYRSGLWR